MSIPDATWMDHAACAEPAHSGLPWLADTDQVTSKHTDEHAAAMAWVCAGCPVQVLCATYAADTFVTGGFWSGQDRLPSGWLTDIAHDVQPVGWVPRSSRRSEQWEQGALNLSGLGGVA